MPAGQVSNSKAVDAQALRMCVRRCQEVAPADGGTGPSCDDTRDATTITDQPRLSLVVSWHSCVGLVSREPWGGCRCGGSL